MPAEPLRIGISLGNTANFQDGLGEFSMQLCQRFAQRAPELRETHGILIDFHLKEKLFGIFGDQVSYLPVTRWQRWNHEATHSYALWHKLHQLNKTLFPNRCLHKVVTVHDLNFLYFKNKFSQWRDFRRIKKHLGASDQMIAISQHVKNDIIQALNPNQPIEVIYNGARNFSAAQAKPPDFAIPQEYLFHLSRMAKSKNIQAILDLAKSWPEKKFVLAGPENDDTRAVRAALEEMGLKNVTLLLSISDAEKAWLYAHCQGFLFPSLTEGFGLPVIEAMHFGRQVFLSKLTSLPEIGGNLAHYFDDFSPSTMKAVIQRGITTEKKNETKIIDHAKSFNWDTCANHYLSLYMKKLGILS